jgi:hypothetical protein
MANGSFFERKAADRERTPESKHARLDWNGTSLLRAPHIMRLSCTIVPARGARPTPRKTEGAPCVLVHLARTCSQEYRSSAAHRVRDTQVRPPRSTEVIHILGSCHYLLWAVGRFVVMCDVNQIVLPFSLELERTQYDTLSWLSAREKQPAEKRTIIDCPYINPSFDSYLDTMPTG